MAKKIKIISLSLPYLMPVFLLLAVFKIDVDAGRGQNIRVAILTDAKEFHLSVRGNFKVVSLPGEKVLSTWYSLPRSVITSAENGIKIAKQEYPVARIKIIPQKDSSINVDNRRYRGEIDIIQNANKSLTVINTVDVEDYVRGILYHEISHRWPLEAIKAQAVAARTYAFYRIKNNKKNLFDVTDDIYSQVYGGSTSERYRTNLAVERTKGLVMIYNNDVLPAYYHATCAGMTEDAVQLWKTNLAPLKGVVCSFCANSPHFRWKKNFRSKDVQDKLNAKGYLLGLIKEIIVEKRNKSDRIETLKIVTRDNQEVVISGKDFRDIIGPNLVRSNNYAVFMKGYYFDLIGKGWGHGVGLCQWGAKEMAHERYLFEEILKFYYPGVKIVSYEAKGF